MQTLEFESLFQQFLHMRDRHQDLAIMGPWLQDQLKKFSFPDLEQLPFVPCAYTRNYVARETPSGGFESLIMRWDKAVTTSIHGHPGFSFYHVISGKFRMELFQPSNTGRINLEECHEFVAQDTIWNLGAMGKFDNFIHRITCLEPGSTFHLYSDDALKGIAMEDAQREACLTSSN